MLGNWSFGDYFKKEAIAYAWELLTNIYKIPKERLYITYFEGNEKLNLPADLEAKELWKQVGVDESRILPYGMKENFWEMGECGPCGPCSEIHFDRIGNRDCSSLVNADDPDVLEIWNLVFMQYNRESDGTLKLLPNKHVDTGMGLERVVSVLQDKRSNYDTDVFMPLFEAIRERTGCRPYTGKVGKDDVDGIDMAYRVVADHIRTLTFAISDGGAPSNEGRGYVLRRILRRGLRYAHEKLGAKEGFFGSMVPVLVAQMGEAFPEISKNPQAVIDILNEEEAQFRKTLERGLQQFHKFSKGASNGVLGGVEAWRLYDTFGFPVDLTRLMAEEAGLKVDEAGYEVAQAEAKEISKGSKSGNEDEANKVVLDVHLTAQLEQKKVEKTDDSFKYHKGTIDAKVLQIVCKGELSNEICVSNGLCGIILDKTNFYAEQGGQLYDTGSILLEDGSAEFSVTAVKSYAGYVLHVGFLKFGSLKSGDKVEAAFDELRRHPLRLNHTATHLLNHAILKTLEGEVDQKGSLVAPDKLRFDFNCKRALSNEEIEKIEGAINDVISKSLPVYTREMPLVEAKNIFGLRAVFGEVYPDPVRVVSVGLNLHKLKGSSSLESQLSSLSVEDKESLIDPQSPLNGGFTIELCGGTHVKNASEIQLFKIVQESNIAKGIRRIVAVTGEAAKKACKDAEVFSAHVSKCKSLKGVELDEKLKELCKEVDEIMIPLLDKAKLRDALQLMRKEFDDADKAAKNAQNKLVTDEVKGLLLSSADPAIIKSFSVGSNTKALLNALNLIKAEGKAGLLLSFDEEAQKVFYQCLIPDSLLSSISANDWCSVVSAKLNGKNGGKDSQSQGSASNVSSSALSDALAAALDFSKSKLHY